MIEGSVNVHCAFEICNNVVCFLLDNILARPRTVSNACQEREINVKSLAMLPTCGIDVFSGVEFVCCPASKAASTIKKGLLFHPCCSAHCCFLISFCPVFVHFLSFICLVLQFFSIIVYTLMLKLDRPIETGYDNIYVEVRSTVIQIQHFDFLSL